MQTIVAVDKNWGIGKDNKLLVSIPADMKFFQGETMGKVVVMGRKTLESFPGGRPLVGRTNIVLTRNTEYRVKGGAQPGGIVERVGKVSSRGCLRYRRG